MIADRYLILVVEDDPFFQDIVTEILEGYEVVCVDNCKSIEQLSSLTNFDVILLDINLPDKNGFQCCEFIREQGIEAPVVFLSQLDDLSSKMKAYGVGGDDYIAKSSGANLIKQKIDRIIEKQTTLTKAIDQAKRYEEMWTHSQQDATNIHLINQFLISCNQCRSVESVKDVFLHTLNQMGTSGVLEIDHSGSWSSQGEIGQLEKEILGLGDKLNRIHQFGNNRVFYNWKYCKLIVRDIQSLIDTIAILMDSMEHALNRITNEEALAKALDQLEIISHQNVEELGDIVYELTDSLSDELLKLGIVSSLSEDDEEDIRNILSIFTKKISKNLEAQSMIRTGLKKHIEKMRHITPEFHAYLQEITGGSDDEADSILF